MSKTHWRCLMSFYYSNYQLLAVVLLRDQAKVLEPSPPYPGYGHPNEHKVHRVSMYDIAAFHRGCVCYSDPKILVCGIFTYNIICHLTFRWLFFWKKYMSVIQIFYFIQIDSNYQIPPVLKIASIPNDCLLIYAIVPCQLNVLVVTNL